MVASKLLSRISLASLLCLLLTALDPIPLAAQEREEIGQRRQVSGTLRQTWSKRRQRHEYFVQSSEEGIRYYLATERDLSDLVGRRVTINGQPRVRDGQKVAEVNLDGARLDTEDALRDSLAAPAGVPDPLDRRLQQHRVAPRPASRPAAPRSVRSAQYVEEVQLGPNDQIVVEGEVPGAMLDVPPLVESSPYLDGGPLALDGVPGPAISPLGGPACESCGAARDSGKTCPCGMPHRVWIRGEYLLWMTKGSYLPPLVTTSPLGTPQSSAGVLGQPRTSILYGDERVLDGDRHGARIVVGTWLDCCQYWGVEADVFGLTDKTADYFASSQGDPILARPFFNAVTEQEDSDLIAYPRVMAGSIDVSLNQKFGGAGIRGRWNLLCNGSEKVRGCGPNTCYHGFRLDAIGGYRFLRLREDLVITEATESLNPAVPVSFDIRDEFKTRNDFHGGDIGLLLEWQRCRWSLELLGKLGLGNSHQVVDINGSTRRTLGPAEAVSEGGILAQRTNIGSYTRDSFALIPEFGVKIGYDITKRLRASVGYTLIYWDTVARPGNQIDPVVNPGLFPPEQNPLQGPLRPAFVFQESDFWAQGLDLGLRYIW